MRLASNKHETKRRRFLLGAFSLLTLAAFGRVNPVPAVSERHRDPGNTDAERMIAALFGDRGAAQAVGRRYLTSDPAEANPATLLAALPKPEATIGTEALREAIGRLRDRDFRDGNLVIIDGWVLARTEARLCALAAFT